ncbi:MAG: UDP-glucose 4-epimerase GalE [Armatimonadetes bacterium]|nr:UDP-glucose 4-epimerase GalE [Armatimonadota bacterium]
MILVLGGAGYIGSHLSKRLRENHKDHVVFDNLSHGHREAVQDSKFFEGDLLDRASLDEVFVKYPIKTVFHFAAHISVGESVREPLKYWRNNTAGVLTLLEAMKDHGIQNLVFSSTAAIFGEPQYIPIDEAHPKSPTSPYGSSKLAVETLLSECDRGFGLRSVCLRYFNAAGADPSSEIGEDHSPEEHLIPVAIEAAVGKRAGLKLFGTDYPTPDGTCVRDYIHILDLAEAHILAAKHLENGGESRRYNLGNGQGFSVKQVIDIVSKVTGLPVPYEEVERRPGDPATLIASSEAIRRDWGWTPKYPDLTTIVEHAWNWHRLHPDGYRTK